MFDGFTGHVDVVMCKGDNDVSFGSHAMAIKDPIAGAMFA